MSISHKYSKDKNIIIATIVGKPTLNEIIDGMKRLVTSNEFQPDTNILWDIKEIDVSTIDADIERSYISARKHFPERGNSKIAIVADNDLQYGMSRMYQMLSDDLPQDVKVFRNYKDAEVWLMN